jgi:hypothetical protein
MDPMESNTTNLQIQFIDSYFNRFKLQFKLVSRLWSIYLFIIGLPILVFVFSIQMRIIVVNSTGPEIWLKWPFVLFAISLAFGILGLLFLISHFHLTNRLNEYEIKMHSIEQIVFATLNPEDSNLLHYYKRNKLAIGLSYSAVYIFINSLWLSLAVLFYAMLYNQDECNCATIKVGLVTFVSTFVLQFIIGILLSKKPKIPA